VAPQPYSFFFVWFQYYESLGHANVFPGDPLLQYDPIYQGVPEKARHLLVSHFDLSLTQPDFALGYNFDIVLRGQNATPFENQ
jgi:protocatechuate 3,4-dioxygenase beta subunit